MAGSDLQMGFAGPIAFCWYEMLNLNVWPEQALFPLPPLPLFPIVLHLAAPHIYAICLTLKASGVGKGLAHQPHL